MYWFCHILTLAIEIQTIPSSVWPLMISFWAFSPSLANAYSAEDSRSILCKFPAHSLYTSLLGTWPVNWTCLGYPVLLFSSLNSRRLLSNSWAPTPTLYYGWKLSRHWTWVIIGFTLFLPVSQRSLPVATNTQCPKTMVCFSAILSIFKIVSS